MSNFNIDPNQISPELLFGILAKMTAGSPNKAEGLTDILKQLPDDKQNIINQMVMKYGQNTDLNSLGISETNGNEDDRFFLHSAAEALLPQPPIDWIVKPLFSAGTVSMVMGDPGSKKTYSLMDLSVCLGSGEQWLNFETKPVSVLLIDEESGARRINRRLGDVMRGHRASKDISLQYISLARFNFCLNGSGGSPDLMVLDKKIRETNSKFIIIDALADVMPGADENAVRDVQPIFMGLRKVADGTESAIVVIHHANKGGKYRGSSAMLGALDGLIKVESKNFSPNIDFTVEKNRDDKPINFAAVAHFENDHFFLTSSQSTKQEKISKPQKYVLKHLNNNGATLLVDIMARADICTANSSKQATYALADQGLVCRSDSGGSGEKATYDLTEKGKNMVKTFM